MDSRRALKSGEITFESELTRKKETTKKRVAVWFSGPRLRCDIEHLSPSGEPTYRDVSCLESEKSGYDAYFTDQKRPGGTIALNFVLKANRKDWSLGRTFDPRVIGYCAANLLNTHSFSLDHVFCRGARNAPVSRQIELDGKPSTEVQFVNKAGADVTYVMVPQCDFNIAKILVKNEFGGKKNEVNVDSTLDKSGGAWYPKQVRFELKTDGVVQETEILKVSHAKFNQAVDTGMFTLAKMNIPEGYPIAGYAPTKVMQWKDGQVKDIPSSARSAIVEDEPSRLKYWVGAAMLGTGGIVLAGLLLRKTGQRA